MKPAVKTVLLLAVLTGAFCVWHWSPSRQPRTGASVTPRPATRRVHRPAPAILPPRTIPLRLAAGPGVVPPSIQPAVEAGSYEQRVARVHALPANLTDQEVQALCSYLLFPSPATSRNRQEENWLRNEMMDKLTAQAALPADVAQVLVAIYQDPAQDIVMRDYSVQHLNPAYVQAGPEQRTILQQALWSAVTETDSSIAGTALLALQNLAQDYKEIDPDTLGEAALNLAGDGRCGELSRLTAVQVCGRLGLKQAAPLLLQLAQNAPTVPLQIASIAALGDVGDEAARAYLQQLAGQADPRLGPALETALRKMNQRPGT